MVKCGVCLKNVKASELKLSCSDCNRDFHASCLNFSKADVECVTADNLVWRCTDCSATRRKSLRLDSAMDEGKLSLEDIMKVITEIRDTQKNNEKSFNTAFVSLDNQLAENTKALKEQNEHNEKLYDLIDSLKTENNQLKKQVKMLEDRIEDMEQYSRSNCVEIQGIPYTAAEDVMSIVKDVGKAMDMTVSGDMVDVCHRLGPRQNSTDPPGIILKFVRKIDKEEFLRKRRVKRDLSTRHIGRADDLPIYVNESLSPARRRLHAMARKYKKDNHFKYLWLRNGKMFLRKEDGAPVKVVTSQEDLK